jgi:hypothetical protein
MEESRGSLTKYLDVPGAQVGDLFYIQNLVAALESVPSLEKVASQVIGQQGDSITYTLYFSSGESSLTLVDTLPGGVSAPGNWQLEGTAITPSYDSNLHRWMWSDTLPVGQRVIIRYDVTITTENSEVLVNTAELSEAGAEPATVESMVLANPFRFFLPWQMRGTR